MFFESSLLMRFISIALPKQWALAMIMYQFWHVFLFAYWVVTSTFKHWEAITAAKKNTFKELRALKLHTHTHTADATNLLWNTTQHFFKKAKEMFIKMLYFHKNNNFIFWNKSCIAVSWKLKAVHIQNIDIFLRIPHNGVTDLINIGGLRIRNYNSITKK